MRFALPVAGLVVSFALLTAQPKDEPKGEYIKKATRTETVRATLASHGLPNLAGKWYFAGPFDNTDRKGFDAVYAPEKKFDLKDTFTGKNGAKFGWKEYMKFELGKVLDLASLFEDKNNAVVYLAHEFESDRAFKLPLSLGSDDSCSVIFNGKRILPDFFLEEVLGAEGLHACLYLLAVDMEMEPLPGVAFEVETPTRLHIVGIDKQAVGQQAALVREKRPPEPYRGKGIRYSDEVIRRKAGKAGK